MLEERFVGEVTCDCGEKYKLMQINLPAREKDTANCRKCGKELERWRGTSAYRLDPID